MTTKHTPGPWIADNVNVAGDEPTAVWRYDGRDDYYLRTEQICECFHDRTDGPHILAAVANARLIAAAPDMLAALRQIAMADHPDYPHFRHGTEHEFGEHLMRVARDAIAKAEGRS